MGVIFDLDGVIVDTTKYHFQSWRRLANELGFDFTEVENEQLKGVIRKESLDLVLSWGGVELSDSEKKNWMNKKNDWYLQFVEGMDQTEIMDGVAPLLAELKFQKIPIALGSASQNAVRILKQVGLFEFFDAIIDGNQVVKGKPNPETFLLGAKAINCLPENCIVFEDSEKGVLAAKTGGFKAIGIGRSEILYKADYVIPGFSNISYNTILELYKRLN